MQAKYRNEKDLSRAGKQDSGLYVETTYKRRINMQNHSITLENVKGKGEGELTWVGDNLGGDGEVFIQAKNEQGLIFLSLEQTLRKIDRFVAKSQQRILSAINFHFELEAR